MMESTAKLTDTNAVLAYLYETYPLCFIAEGETKPLKIGLFQDLAERLTDDSKISKTQLRVALRRYTSSWRYLKSIKAGAQRVDLNGEPCGELSQEHIEHAQATLKESREKAKAKRVAQAKKVADENKKPRSNTRPNKPKAGKPDFKRNKNSRFEKVKSEAKKPAETVNLSPIELSDLKQNQRVNVKLGMTPVKGVVVDINKEDVHVQLDSGLTVKVRSEHILV